MTIVKFILTFIEVLTSILLVTVILMQKTKQQGAGGLAFGAGVGEQLFGVQAGNVLTRITTVLTIIFLTNTCVLAIVGAKTHSKSVTSQFSPPAAQTVPQTPVSAPQRPVEETVPIPSSGGDAPLDISGAIPGGTAPVAVPANVIPQGDSKAGTPAAPAAEPAKTPVTPVTPPAATPGTEKKAE